MRQVLLTPRLRLREFDEADADFIVSLLNDADFIRYIADKNVRNAEDARLYLRDGPLASYARNGFGLWCVERLSAGVPVGMCGLGYALEAAQASVAYGRDRLGLPRVVAIVSPGNRASEGLLLKLGLQCRGSVDLGRGPGLTHLYS